MRSQVGLMADEIMKILKDAGFGKDTLKNTQKVYRAATKWFELKNDGNYSFEVFEMFQEIYIEKYSMNKITRRYFLKVMRALKHLREYHDNGKVNYDRIDEKNKYVPNSESMKIVMAALDSVELSERYKKRMEANLRKFFCYAEESQLIISEINNITLREYMTYIYPGNSASMDMVVHALKILTNHLACVGIIEDKPNFSYLTPKKSVKKIIPSFSEDEVARILSATDTEASVGKRNYAMLLLAYQAGLRSCDINNLKFSDVNWESSEVNIVQSKTQKTLSMPITEQLKNALADYILYARPYSKSEHIFLSIRAPFEPAKTHNMCGWSIDKLCQKVGVAKKQGRRFHSLRRSFGTWLANEDIDFETVSQMLGHASPDSSKPYISFNDDRIYDCAMGFYDIPIKGGVYL